MNIRIAGGVTENGIVVGNAYDKYGAKNPVVRWIMAGFEKALSDLVGKASPSSVHEVGCGEGYWVLRWAGEGITARGCDFSSTAIDLARRNAIDRGLDGSLFEVKSIYDLLPGVDNADLLVCCEVLEHLEHPEKGLAALQGVVDRHLIVSVPREPLWCALNMVRGKYLASCGNTPGHIQHWSRTAFIKLVSKYFEVVEIRSPLPWVMLLCRPLADKTR